MKYKVKRRRKALKTQYIIIIIITILVLISTSYALWNTTLYINGTVIGKFVAPKLPIEIPSQGTDSNGVNRYTSNTSLKFVDTEIYRVVDEKYEENIITTTIQHKYKQAFSWSSINATITLAIPNNTSSNFEDGKIELVKSSDNNNILQDLSYKLSDNMIQTGSIANLTITGTLKGNIEVANNTYYNFTISYKIGEIRYYFYYNLILLPRN